MLSNISKIYCYFATKYVVILLLLRSLWSIIDLAMRYQSLTRKWQFYSLFGNKTGRQGQKSEHTVTLRDLKG